jgi:hypothetical protein
LKKRGRIDVEVVSALDDEMLKRFAFCGTVEQLQEYVRQIEDIGFTDVVFGPPVGLSKKGVANLVSARASM